MEMLAQSYNVHAELALAKNPAPARSLIHGLHVACGPYVVQACLMASIYLHLATAAE